MTSEIGKNYENVLRDLKEKIMQARLRASVTVNTQLLAMYWEIGNAISQQEIQEGWGAKIVEVLARDLKEEFPDMKGLSMRNLRYMRDFALAYPQFKILRQSVAKFQDADRKPILQQSVAKLTNPKMKAEIVQHLVAQLPWGHNCILLDKLKTPEHRIFYAAKTIENGWSRDILILQIETKLHERQGKAITNFETTLPKPQSDLAKETLKNPYVFDFLSFSEEMQERELEKALTLHIKSFLLELGRGFAYVGNQYNLKVEADVFFLDLLFYNYHLHCFVLFELKVGKFKPEYAGKLNFYINTVDEQIKGADDNPSIGVLLCKTPNKTVVRYALQGIKTPLGVAGYELAVSLPKKFKGEIPSTKELERELEKEAKEFQKPSDKKLDHLKQLISGFKNEEAREKQNPENTRKIFTKVLLPLKKQLTAAIADISKMFDQTEIMTWSDGQGHKSDRAAREYVTKRKLFGVFRIDVRFTGFKKAGVHAFNSEGVIEIAMSPYKYIIGTSSNFNDIVIEKLYHQLPTEHEINKLLEKFLDVSLSDITQMVERIKQESK